MKGNYYISTAWFSIISCKQCTFHSSNSSLWKPLSKYWNWMPSKCERKHQFANYLHDKWIFDLSKEEKFHFRTESSFSQILKGHCQGCKINLKLPEERKTNRLLSNFRSLQGDFSLLIQTMDIYQTFYIQHRTGVLCNSFGTNTDCRTLKEDSVEYSNTIF